MYPHQLGGYEAHRMRNGGDLSHVDTARSHLNERLIGEPDWAERAKAEIGEMAMTNYAAELASLEKRNRRKTIKRRIVEGPKAPWRSTRHGPLREVILTANAEWFDAGEGFFAGEDGNAREEAFQERAKAWLLQNFGDDVIHARADRDEQAYHIHAVIMPRATVVMDKPNSKVAVATATRQMLQPSIHPFIKDYEAAQDDVGAWFEPLGLVRGECRAAKIREARANGEEPPKRRYHAKTRVWRAKQEQLLLEEQVILTRRETDVETREDEAEAILAVVDGVSNGTVDFDISGPVPTIKTSQSDTDAENEQLRYKMARSPKGVARAASAFGALWKKLAGRSKVIAERNAKSALKRDFEEIRAADDVLVEIAGKLPKQEATMIVEKRSRLVVALRRLEKTFGGRKHPKQGKNDRDASSK